MLYLSKVEQSSSKVQLVGGEFGVTLEDGGTFICRAENELGSIQVTVSVNIQGMSEREREREKGRWIEEARERIMHKLVINFRPSSTQWTQLKGIPSIFNSKIRKQIPTSSKLYHHGPVYFRCE